MFFNVKLIFSFNSSVPISSTALAYSQIKINFKFPIHYKVSKISVMLTFVLRYVVFFLSNVLLTGKINIIIEEYNIAKKLMQLVTCIIIYPIFSRKFLSFRSVCCKYLIFKILLIIK